MNSAVTIAWLGFALFGFGGESAFPPPDIRPVRTVVATVHAEGEPVSLASHIRARTEESLAFRIDCRMIARRVGAGQVVKLGPILYKTVAG